MKILMVHNSYLTPGGEDESTEAEELLLRNHDHEVDSLRESNQTIENIGILSTATRTVWSSDAYHRVRERLRQKKYDVVHVQNFFPLLSPSVYYAAKAEGVSVVQTLRNYRLLCPKATFFRDGKPCEDCLGRAIPWPGVAHACYRNSRAGTTVVAGMLVVHRFLRTWSHAVDVFVALTEFSRRKFLEGNLPEHKILVKPNFVYPDLCAGDGSGNYYIFVGRLAPEKGVGTLLSAWESMGERVTLKIVGDGPLAPQVAQATRKMRNIEWLGHRTKKEVSSLVAQASGLIFPSEWYEGMPRTLIESLAVGTPVVAADIGSMKEMIQNDENGVLFKAGNPHDLRLAVEKLLANPSRMLAMRKSARADYEAKYTAERNLPLLLAVYKRAIRPTRNEPSE